MINDTVHILVGYFSLNSNWAGYLKLIESLEPFADAQISHDSVSNKQGVQLIQLFLDNCFLVSRLFLSFKARS